MHCICDIFIAPLIVFCYKLCFSLDNELDLIDTQQKELEDVLAELEGNLTQYQPLLSEAQHADIERTRT